MNIQQDTIDAYTLSYLDMMRLKNIMDKYEKTFVHICHCWGGGTSRYVNDLVQLASHEDYLSIVISCKNEKICIECPGYNDLYLFPNLKKIDESQVADYFSRILEHSSVHTIFMNSIVAWPLWAIDKLCSRCEHIEASINYVIHDFAARCSRNNFTKANGEFCGGYSDVETCQICIGRQTIRLSPSIEGYQIRQDKLLSLCDNIIAPSQSAATIFRSMLPYNPVVIPHHFPSTGFDKLGSNVSKQSPESSQLFQALPKLKIAILGTIGPHKGHRELRQLIQICADQVLDVEFKIFGTTSSVSLDSNLENLSITGPYEGDREATHLLSEWNPDLALFLSKCPETYMYTLSLIFDLGIPAIGLDIGAQGERIKRYSRGILIENDAYKLQNIAKLFTDFEAIYDLKKVPLKSDLKAYKNISDYLSKLAST